MTSARRRLVIAAVVAACLAGALAFAFWPRSATPVTIDDSVENFREDIATTTPTADAPVPTATATPTPKPVAVPADTDDTSPVDDQPDDDEVEPQSTENATSPLPAVGVYTFDATGTEHIKFGPFPAEDRTYPVQIPVTILAADGDCFTVTIDYFEQHAEDTTYCVGPDNVVHLTYHEKRQTVGALSPVMQMSCDPDVVYVSGEDGNITCELDMSAGPATQHASLSGTFTDAGSDTLDIDGTPTAARRIAIHYDVSGDLTGTWDETIWLDVADWTPLRFERSVDLAGLANFVEESELQLAQRTPNS